MSDQHENAERAGEMLVWADALGFAIEDDNGVRRYVPKRMGMGLPRKATDAEAALWDALSAQGDR